MYEKFPNIFKKYSEIFQKIFSKKRSKIFRPQQKEGPRVSKNISKNFQKNFKKYSKIFSGWSIVDLGSDRYHDTHEFGKLKETDKLDVGTMWPRNFGKFH